MADERRTLRQRGRSGSRGPSRPVGSGRGPGANVQRKQAQRERVATVAAAKAAERERSRLTGRAAILVLVLAVLAVSFASSARAYLQQRSRLDTLEAQIAESKAAIGDLEREKRRWEDPAYVAQEARERFGYVPVGETPFVVLDDNGDPLGTGVALDEPRPAEDERAWVDDLWDSVKYAGDPPTRMKAPPKRRISEDPEDKGAGG